MRKPEQKMYDYLNRQMMGLWDHQRHEDKYSPDTPDLSYALKGVDGWIELKTIPAWPKMAGTPVKIPHLYPGQVNWIERRGVAGSGHVSLLLAVGIDMAKADWLIIPWYSVRKVYETGLTKTDLQGRFVTFSGAFIPQYLPLQLKLA